MLWSWAGPDGCPAHALCFFLQGLCLVDLENSDMGWGAAHTQEFRWVERRPDTHACKVSFHPLAGIQWGVNTKPTRGRTDSLPDSDMHCLPVNPTTKRDIGSLEGLMLVITNFLECYLRKKREVIKEWFYSIRVMQHKMADTMLLWRKKANKYW